MPYAETVGHRTQYSTRSPRQRGSLLLLWALTCSTAVFALTLGYFPFFQSTVASSGRAFQREQALALADAGMEHALWEIRTNNGANISPATPTGGWTAPVSTACDDEIDGGTDGLLYGMSVTTCRRFTPATPLNAGDELGGPLGTYTMWVVNYGSPLVRVVARGFVPHTTAPLATQTVTLDLQRPETFQHAMMGSTKLRLLGRVSIDSYDSTQGAYGGLNVRSNGTIGTNGDGGAAADLVIDHAATTVNGTGWLTSGDTSSIVPLGQPSGGLSARADLTLPTIQIPQDLQALPLSLTTADLGNPPGVGSGIPGEFGIPAGVTYTCDQPLRVRAFWIAGTLEMTNNCQLYIDNSGGYRVLHNGGGAALDTDGSGQILKLATGRTRIFLDGADFDLDGRGIGYSASVPEANRLPKNLQVYVKCPTPPCSAWGVSSLKQTLPFYGVVYAQGSALDLWRGSEGGGLTNARYYGAFASTRGMAAVGEATCCTAFVHFDERLQGLWLDGSGTDTYQIRAGSWSTQ